MTHATEEFGPDLTEAIPETFDVCEDCGTPTIQLSSHTCPDPETVDDPTREDLDARVNNDLTQLSRAEAQHQRYAPCQFCQRIRRANEEVTGR